MSKSILGILICLLIALQARADQPTFNISSLDATPGQIIDVNVHVDDFIDLIVVQYSVNWDPTVLDFRAIKNFNANVPGLNSSVFGTEAFLTDAGRLTLGWLEPSVTPVTIADGSLFFTIEFEVIGDPCDNSLVAITDIPTEIVVAEEGEVEVGLIANNGEINVPGTGCAQDVLFTGTSVTGPCNGNACVQFSVQNFTDVGAMQFALEYNPAIIQFDEVRNYGPLPGFGPGNTNLNQPGELRVVWTHPNAENASLADGTVLFEVCFDVIGQGGQSSQITFGNSFLLLVSDIDGNEYNVDIVPAQITSQCALEGFALIADTICMQPGEVECMDIKVNDFEEIVALQLSINWDSTRFQFERVEGFGLPGLDAGSFGIPSDLDVDEGELTLSWIDLSLQGVTVPDFATIFRVCLKARGAAGTSSPVTFSATPLTIEVLDANDSLLVPALIQGRAEIKQDCEGCEFSYTATTTSPDCPREASGGVNLTVTENCPESPTFVWNTNPQVTTEDLTGVAAGTYTVTITLGSQVVIAMATVTDPPGMNVTGTTTNPNPIGSSTGSIDITVTGGQGPYTYVWSPGGATTEDLTNIPCGTYTVTVTDSKGCTFIPDPFILCSDLTAAITNVSCGGGNDGSISVSATYGTPPYTFVWNTTPPQTTSTISNLVAGQYCVTVTDSGGSSRDTCFNVTQPNPIVLNANITHDINENCMGAIDLIVTGGTLPYSYQWSNGPTSQDQIQLCIGQYCVTVTDGGDCTATMCFNVFADGLSVSLTATQYGNFQTSCPGVCDGAITSVVNGGSGNLTYAWSNNATSPNLANVCAGTYTVTVTDGSGTTATATIVISSPPPFTFSFITTPPTDFITSNGAIAVVVNGGFPPYSYTWTGPVGGSTAALNNVPAGTYTIEVTDANGCEAIDAEQLLPDLDVPCYSAIKVITPNSDGKNDFFIITCVFDFDNHLYIFNRTGALVYETDNYQNNWDGVDQDGEAVPDGGYLWVLEVVRQDGSTQLIKGTVNVLRTAD